MLIHPVPTDIRTGELKYTRYHLNVPGILPLDWN